LGREGTTVILDEVSFHIDCLDIVSQSLQFYSWYIYPEHERDLGKAVSSAEYIEDVNQDAVVIVDGLTKVWGLKM